MYNSSNFIAPYNLTDYVLSFIDTNNRRVININVCRYLNLGVDSNIIWVSLEGNEKITLEFSSALEANSAATLLKNALDTLVPNCPIGGSGGSPLPSQTLTIIDVTVAEYETLRSLSQLTDTVDADKVQWYDVTDTGNLFGEGVGSKFRVLALNPTDGLPAGFCINTLRFGVLDFDNHKFKNTYLNSNNIYTSNDSYNNSGSAKNIFVINKSTLSGNKNEQIYLNNSTVNFISCANIYAQGCSNLILEDSDQCYFENINEDLHYWRFSTIRVHPTDSIGKVGHRNLASLSSQTLKAYLDDVYNYLVYSAKGNIYLQNVITQANATFKFIIPDNFIGSVKIYDYASSVLILTIDESYAGLTLSFIYDKNTGNFYYEKSCLDTKQTLINLVVSIDGQTSFPGVLTYTPKDPRLSILTVNGQKLIYTIDYDFSGLDVVYTNASFELSISDYVELIYE